MDGGGWVCTSDTVPHGLASFVEEDAKIMRQTQESICDQSPWVCDVIMVYGSHRSHVDIQVLAKLNQIK